MECFLNEVIEWEKFELLIDTNIFNKIIILKTAYNFLDKWYFFFKLNLEWNIILQFTAKDWVNINPKNIIWDFSDELLNNVLREVILEENKEIRTEIITSALQNSLREAELPNSWKGYEESWDGYFDWWSSTQEWTNQIDFDKDIDEILREIENDPDLKIDEAEIERILKEIEEESEKSIIEPSISINLDAVAELKKKFNN